MLLALLLEKLNALGVQFGYQTFVVVGLGDEEFPFEVGTEPELLRDGSRMVIVLNVREAAE